MKRLVALIVLVVFTAPVHGAPETYVIDSRNTSSEFAYRSLGMANRTHRFDAIRGELVLDAATRTGSADVTIDATSVNTGSALLDAHIQTADFFDTANHPAITFKSTRVVLDGETPSMTGNLTIKGITRSVTLALAGFQCLADPISRLEACGGRAAVTIKRSDFNMGGYAFLVSNEITLKLALTAVKPQHAVQLASRDRLR